MTACSCIYVWTVSAVRRNISTYKGDPSPYLVSIRDIIIAEETDQGALLGYNDPCHEVLRLKEEVTHL